MTKENTKTPEPASKKDEREQKRESARDLAKHDHWHIANAPMMPDE